MKHLLFCVLITLCACKGKPVAEGDLTGKTYSVSVKLDSVQAKNGLTAGFLAMTKMEYTFKAAGQGMRYVNTIGTVLNDPFIWSIHTDSLVLVSISENQLLRQAFSLQRTDKGLLIRDGKNELELTKK